MFIVYLLPSLLFVSGQCLDLIIPHSDHDDEEMIQCVIRILDDCFSERKSFTYVNMNPSDEELLQTIHSTMNFSLINRESTQPMSIPNQGYLVFSPDVDTFTEFFEELIREELWNPYARFLIVIESLSDFELRPIFDILLRLHVSNVIVMNGTDEGHVYGYNPFDNNACGRYYDTVISYGECTETTDDLYPDKFITGLTNCTFRATTAHRPPFTIDPKQNEYRNKMPGMEPYLLKLASEKSGFKMDIDFNYKGTYSTIAPNMTVFGPMSMLQKNETDVVFGGLTILSSYIGPFSYTYGHHDYVDEIRFVVKKASLVPNWQYFYLEFNIFIWLLILFSIVIYSGMIIFFLRGKDKGIVILELLDNLVLHSRAFRCPMTVKYMLIIWVWFAYLINTVYQSSLVSLTTNPLKEYQIADENDIEKFNIRPCISRALATYVFTEPSKRKEYNETRLVDPHCDTVLGATELTKTNREIYTLVPSYFFMFNKQTFNDKWGNPLIHYFDTPYKKLLFGFYFYKGFPMPPNFRMAMIRMRENGLAEKNLHDQYYLRSIKFSFAQKEFKSRFVYPWVVHVVGCTIASLTFVIEILSKYFKRYRFTN